MSRTEANDLYHDISVPLPPYGEPTELVWVHDLKTDPIPEGAIKYVRTTVHEVIRPDGSRGYQVVNGMAKGVSLVPVDVVNGHGYAILLDQMRYPHRRPGAGHDDLTLEQVARLGAIGRWSRETISGGINPSDGDGEEGLRKAVLREAEEEAGVTIADPDRLIRLYPTLGSSVSVNDQPFNLYAARLEAGEWNPELAFPDIEEGNVVIGAYRLDTAVPEMIDNGTIWELSTVTALSGLWRVNEFRKYL